MDNLFVVAYDIQSAALAEPLLSLNLTVDTVHESVQGHAHVIIDKSQTINFAVQGQYLTMEDGSGLRALMLTAGAPPFPVIDVLAFQVLLVLSDGWQSGQACYKLRHGLPHPETIFVRKAIAIQAAMVALAAA